MCEIKWMATLSLKMITVSLVKPSIIFKFLTLTIPMFSFRADCMSKEVKASCEEQVSRDSFKGKAKEMYTVKSIWKPTRTQV